MVKKKIAVIVFIIILVLPIITWPFLVGVDKTELEENREPASFPQFSDNFFVGLNDYLTDRVPFRNLVISNYSEFELYLQKHYEVILNWFGEDFYMIKNDVLFGKKDWLFFAGDEALPQYKGLNQFSDEVLTEYVHKAEKVKDYFASQNKQFCIFIAPNKEQIYSEYMPGILVDNQIKQMDRLAQFFSENSTVPVIYPKDELLTYKQNNSQTEIYYRQDSHWNDVGAYIGCKALFSSLNKEIGDLIFTEYMTTGGDLSNLIARSGTSYPAYHLDYQSKQVNSGSLLLVGDSFRSAMGSVLNQEFASAKLYHRSDYYQTGLADDFETADIIVLEAVERYEAQIFAPGGMLDSLIRQFDL